MQSVPSNAIKTYTVRGPLQQFRFAESIAFHCFRCGASKKSKLITIHRGDWSKRLCNGCYGRLLSIYEIKAGTASEDERAEELAKTLLSLMTSDEHLEADRLILASERRASQLSAQAVRFISTAERLAVHLSAEEDLEWSPVIIGLCKAVEIEIVSRMIRPLANYVATCDLADDKRDKDIGRIAAFCVDSRGKPPELGSFAHFLRTVIHSQERRQTSALIRAFLVLAREWTGSQWLLDPSGLNRALLRLTMDFRNPAAHIDELAKDDYARCKELVIGRDGVLWKLVISVQHHR